MATCLIGLGANHGDRTANLAAASRQLSEIPEINVLRVSRFFHSKAAVGGAAQVDFINAALTLETSLVPRQLLLALQHVENQLGRRRDVRWGPRNIDLDLLLYDDVVMDEPGLVVPHPRMTFRRFVLEPAAEIAPDFIHAATEFDISELLARLDIVPRRISVTGAASQQNRELSRQVAMRAGVDLVEDRAGGELPDRLAALRASPSCQTAIELASQQRDAWRTTDSCANQANAESGDDSHPDAPNRTEIRNSWSGECHALARLLLPTHELEKFERCWRNEPAADELDRTTLILVIASPPLQKGKPADDVHSPSAAKDEGVLALQTEIKRLATAPRQTTWLQLDSPDPDWALTEAVAAIEAMQ